MFGKSSAHIGFAMCRRDSQISVVHLQMLIEATHSIINITKEMLADKMQQADLKDLETKKDLMSLLIK